MKLDQSFSEAFVLASAEGHFYGAAAQQVDTRCKPGEELQNHVQITSNYIDSDLMPERKTI